MLREPEVLAIIPARGGSKGIPRKNLRRVAGLPLVSRSVLHAQDSGSVTRVIVSTDDDEIAACARQAGAEVPFLRPGSLALDHVLDLPVFQHALQYLWERERYRPDLVLHLRPTSPHRKAEWIDDAVALLWNNPQADSVRSVSPPAQHPYKMFRTGPGGFLQPIMQHEHPTPHGLRRQDLPPVLFFNSVIDVTRPATISQGSMTGARMLPYLMRPEDVVDIDTPQDLELAEQLLRERELSRLPAAI